ncbi:MAG: PAS domain-containing protein, partial [Chloroflexales bacterium]|nr:PAS domain-containing protein [Chloroflexales bacterium]
MNDLPLSDHPFDERLGGPVRAVPVGLSVLDSELRFLHLDPTFVAILGSASADQRGQPLAAVLPTLAPAIEPLLRRVLMTGEPILDVDVRGEMPGGRQCRWRSSYYPVRAGDGSVTAVECAVTELDQGAPFMGVSAARAAPQAGEEYFRAIQELSLDGVGIVRSVRDAHGAVVDFVCEYLNPVAERLAGQPLALLRGRRLTEVFPGAQANGLLSRYLQIFASGEPQAFEQYYDADGISAWYRNMVVRVGDGLAIVFSDITAQKRTEAALRGSEERFHQFAAAVKDIFWISDPAQRRLLYVSPAYEQLMGRSSAALYANFMEWIEAIHPDDRERVASAFFERIYAGTYEEEFRVVRPDGSIRWIRDRGFPIWDVAGKIYRAAGIAEDITQRKQAEDEQAQMLSFITALSEALTPAQVAAVIFEKVHAALGARSGAVVLLSEDGQALEVLETTGYPPGLVERWPHLRVDMPIPLAEAARSGQPVWAESPAELATRYPRLLELVPEIGAGAALPLKIQQRVIGVLGVNFAGPRAFSAGDRFHLQVVAQQCAQALERAWLYESERRAHVAAEEAVRTRDELLALVSHDLRNPLTVILGQDQIMVKHVRALGEPGERLLPRLTVIRDMVSQMEAQLDELLDAAQLQAGQALYLNCQPMDLVGLVREVVGAIQATSVKHQIRLTAPDLALMCLGDRRRLARVFANLLRNAISYSPTGGAVEVAITQEADAAGGWVAVSVRDAGIGIPAADLPRVFERFYRGANAVGRIRGTGLGLASARYIVEQHEGSIQVESVEGSGSTFTVRLPSKEL